MEAIKTQYSFHKYMKTHSDVIAIVRFQRPFQNILILVSQI